MFNLNIKAMLVAGATALLAVLAAALWVQTERLHTADAAFAALSDRHKTLAEAHNRALERAVEDRKVLVAREAKIASQARELRLARQGLKTALQASPEWAATQVPTEVQNALSRRSGGSGDPARVRPVEPAAHPD